MKCCTLRSHRNHHQKREKEERKPFIASAKHLIYGRQAAFLWVFIFFLFRKREVYSLPFKLSFDKKSYCVMKWNNVLYRNLIVLGAA
jgi:hypothetical protein